MLINVEIGLEGGIIRDIPPRRLGLGTWSGGRNIRMADVAAQKFRGHEEIFATPPVPFYGTFSAVQSLNQYWVLAGLAKLYVHDGSMYTDITRASGDYNATAEDKWTGGTLTGITVLNNPKDNPQYWPGTTGTPAADLPNWPPPGVTTMRAQVIRPFLNLLIAGDITKDSNRFPMMVKWSSIADPGTVPDSWDETDATENTGEQDLADTPGFIVDMLPVGRSNIVYKEDAVVAMTFVNRTEVFDFEWLSQTFGLFTQNCVASVGRNTRHIAFGYDDVVALEGRRIESVINRKNRRWLFNSLDEDNKKNAFVVTNTEFNEVWICFPETGNTWCNLALVYNWQDDSWGVRDLPDVSHAASGVLDPGTSPLVYDSWTTTTYDEALFIYDQRQFDPSTRNILAAAPTATKLYQMDQSETFDGTSFEALVERTGLAVTLSRTGNLVPDFDTRKLIKRVIPYVEGTGDLMVYVGGQETMDGSYRWSEGMTYRIGEDRDVKPWFSTKIPAFRFVSTGNQTWRLTGFTFEQDTVGRHW